MRLFTAVCFDEKTKDFLEQCQIKIRECICGGNFTSRDNLHLTLIFLGEVSPNKILDLKQSVDKVKFDKFELTFNVIGSFRRRESSIVWVGFKPNRMLSAVYENLAAELKYSGFLFEERKYTPHATLVRQALHFDPQRTADLSCKFSFEVSEIAIMKSEYIKGKLIYSKI